MRTRNAILLALVVAVGASVVLFWPTPRRRALARVEDLEGNFYEQPDETGRTISIVLLTNRPVTDDDLVVLQGIRPLHRLLLDGTRVTDAGMAHLEGFEGLEWVSCCTTAVTDEGMGHLKRVPGLRALHLGGTRVSDKGIASLHGLPNLEVANVRHSRVTPSGVDEWRRTTPSLKSVFFSGPE